MKKIFKQIIFIAIVSLAFTACDSVDFGDTNVNPNEPSTAPAAGLLTNAMRTIGSPNTPSGVVMSTTAMLYAQYLANGQYPDEGRYVTLNWNYYGFYAGALRDLQEVVKVSVGTSNEANTTAVSTLVRAYLLHHMTDRWGYMPYSEALNGLDNKTPKFDSQEDIYKGLFNEIDAALAMINTSKPGAAGDIIFDGDMARWKQFGNTLKVVMALRLSKRNTDIGGLAKTKFNEAIGNVITSASDNIHYKYLADDNNDHPLQDRFVDQGRKDWIMSDVLVNYMIGTGTDTAPQDPRLAKYADPVAGTSKFVGARYGSGNDLVDNFSFITSNIITNSEAPGIIFTAAQMHFSMAEAVELGWMAGSAEAHFKMAIQESMNQWGVAQADATAFIASLTYNGMQSIAEQKWVSLFMQGYEGWAEWRRIGGPATILPPAIMLNGSGVPRRQAYPSTTPSINKASYDAAVAAQGADDLDTKLWWDN